MCTAAGTLKDSRALQRESQLTKHFMAVRLFVGAGLGGMYVQPAHSTVLV